MPANLPPEAQQAFLHGGPGAQAWIAAQAEELRQQQNQQRAATQLREATSPLEFGIEIRGMQQAEIQTVIEAARRTGQKLASYIPDTPGTPSQAFNIAMGDITILLGSLAYIDDYVGNCLTRRNSPTLVKRGKNEDFAYRTFYEREVNGKREMISVNVNTPQTIVCRQPPTEANLIHEFGHVFTNQRTAARGVNFFDLTRPIPVGDGTYLDLSKQGYWERSARGFLQGERSWEHKPLDNDKTSGVAKLEHFADTFLNWVYDGTGNRQYGFSSNAYGEARCLEMNWILLSIFGGK